MNAILMILFIACFFLSGMNFAVWLNDTERTRSLVLSCVLFTIGLSDLVALLKNIL